LVDLVPAELEQRPKMDEKQEAMVVRREFRQLLPGKAGMLIPLARENLWV
jgi:hypothetical protein